MMIFGSIGYIFVLLLWDKELGNEGGLWIQFSICCFDAILKYLGEMFIRHLKISVGIYAERSGLGI